MSSFTNRALTFRSAQSNEFSKTHTNIVHARSDYTKVQVDWITRNAEKFDHARFDQFMGYLFREHPCENEIEVDTRTLDSHRLE